MLHKGGRKAKGMLPIWSNLPNDNFILRLYITAITIGVSLKYILGKVHCRCRMY